MRLWQGEPVQRPAQVRGWRPPGYALERHRGPGLQGVSDEAVQETGGSGWEGQGRERGWY